MFSNTIQRFWIMQILPIKLNFTLVESRNIHNPPTSPSVFMGVSKFVPCIQVWPTSYVSFRWSGRPRPSMHWNRETQTLKGHSWKSMAVALCIHSAFPLSFLLTWTRIWLWVGTVCGDYATPPHPPKAVLFCFPAPSCLTPDPHPLPLPQLSLPTSQGCVTHDGMSQTPQHTLWFYYYGLHAKIYIYVCLYA